MKITDRILLYTVSAAVVVLIGWKASSSMATPEVAYVNIGKMLDGYKFKKSLEQVSSQDLNKIKTIIDSLEMLRKVGVGSPRVDTQLFRARHAFKQYYLQSNEEITKKVWERLNPLMEQYGSEKGLQLMIGATGTGTVLFGSKKNDVTDDLTLYVNTRFEKGN